MMKIRLITLNLILIVCICPTVFAQKCRQKPPKVVVFTNQGGPKITHKPQPEYTKEARHHETQGTVILRGLFHSSGKVQDVCWVRSLPYGLTKNAIKAAYQIVFEPVTKDGKPISVTRFIEYNFNLF